MERVTKVELKIDDNFKIGGDFSEQNMVLVHTSEEEAKLNQFYFMIGRAIILKEKKKVFAEIYFINSLPTDKYFEKKKKKNSFYPHYNKNNEIISLFSEEIS